MGFTIMEIVGLAVLGVAFVLQISATATLKWLTFSLSTTYASTEVDAGIFKQCTTTSIGSVKKETCTTDNWAASNKEGYLKTCRATTILAFLAVFATIILIAVFKFVLKKSSRILVIILGIIAAVFQIVAVAVFAEKLKPENPKVEYGASFYIACVSIGFIVIGTALSAIGAGSIGRVQ